MARWKAPELIEALAKIFRSPEGPALAELLRRKIGEIGPPENSALQRHEGERSFASDLLQIADGRAAAYERNERPAPESVARVPGRRVPPENLNEAG